MNNLEPSRACTNKSRLEARRARELKILVRHSINEVLHVTPKLLMIQRWCLGLLIAYNCHHDTALGFRHMGLGSLVKGARLVKKQTFERRASTLNHARSKHSDQVDRRFNAVFHVSTT